MAGEADDIAYVTRLVRDFDRPRYYAALFSPAALRPGLFALFGFAAEIARVPDLINEPQLGEIRLQWWHDALKHATNGPGDAPAIRALSRAIEKHALPVDALAALVDASRRDLYSDPLASVRELEGFLGETQSSLFQLAAIIHGSRGAETADASGHAGIAYGLAQRLARFDLDVQRGRTILPTMQGAGHGAASLIALARRHLVSAEKHAFDLARSLQGPFLPLAVVRPLLGRIEAATNLPTGGPVTVPELQCLARIAWTRLRGLGTTV